MTASFGTVYNPGNYADFLTVGPWLVMKFLVKVQFRGPKLFKKKGALFQEELYLPGIFMPPWTSWRYDCGWMASIRM